VLVLLIELLQPAEAITVDYLQDSRPALVIEITPLEQAENDVYVLDARSHPLAGDDETVEGGSVRIEQSDLYASNYLVYPDTGTPFVVDTAPFRRQLVGRTRLEDTVFTVDGAGSAAGETTVGAGLSGELFLLAGGETTILLSPSAGITLIIR
jgi:hypothetical protein